MRKRLYNEYGAAHGPHAEFIEITMRDAARKCINYANEHDLDVRDVVGYANGWIDIECACHHIRLGIITRKAKQDL